MKTKSEQRKYAKSLLADLAEQTKKEKSQLISSHLVFLIKYLGEKQFPSVKPLKIGSYCPIQSEVSWYLEMEATDYKFLFPKIYEDKSMNFYALSLAKLKELNWGITVPDEEAKDKETADILLIPGLLFSEKGERLGRGSGYYDRYLEKFQGVKVGVSYHDQISDEINTEKNDCLLDFIVTDKCIYKNN